MTTLSFDFNLTDLGGKPQEGDSYHLGRTLANVLAGVDKHPAATMKLYDWAVLLWKKEPIVVDETDKAVLEAFIETSEYLSRLQKGQLLKSIKTQSESKK